MLNLARGEVCGPDALFVCSVSAGNSSVQLEQMTPKDNAGRRGVSAASLVAAARANLVDVQAVRSSLPELLRWGQPAVLHVNDDHFVGLLGAEGGRLVVFDNSIGLIDCSSSWFEKQYRWGGVALVVGHRQMWRCVLSSPWLGIGALGAALVAAGARPRRKA